MIHRWLAKRTYLAFIPLLLLLAGIAVACGDDATPTAPATSTSPAPTATSPVQTPTAPRPTSTSPGPTQTSPAPTATPVPEFFMRPPEANPKYGGTFQICITSNTPHFDLWAAASPTFVWTQIMTYNTLMRFDDFKEGFTTRRPDLATKWEFSPDGKDITLTLRKGVKFHDGSDFGAEDVKATWDRIIFPATGLISGLQANFDAVTEVKVIDPLTVQFKQSEARAFTLEGLSLPEGAILKKEILEENKGDMKRVFPTPGTGPYISTDRIPGESWTYKKNANYWDPVIPYVDGLKINNTNWGPDTSACFLAGQADFVMGLDSTAYNKAADDPKFVVNQFPSTSQQGLWFNHDVKPFDDKRVRKAFHLVIDYGAIRKAANPIQPFKERGWILQGDPFFADYWAKAKNEPGWRTPTTAEDIAAAKALMKDAGLEDGIKDVLFRGRDEVFERAFIPIIQALLKQHLKIETNVQLDRPQINLEILNTGDFDISEQGPGFPTPFIFQQWGPLYTAGGSRNWGNYESPEFTSTFKTLLGTTDRAKQIPLVNHLLDILDEDVPGLTWAQPGINQAWKKDVKGHAGGNRRAPADFMRWDVVWLDR